MLDIPGFPDPAGLVTVPSATVTWKGHTINASKVSLSRSLGTGLPSQVAGVDDLVAATGTVEAEFSDELVAEGLHLPWVVERPQPGDPVTITVGLEGVEVPVLTGRVDDAGATVSDRSVRFSVVDRVDRLRRTVSIPPLDFYHPPAVEGGPIMQIGLHPTFLTDRVARRCGFYATPPMHEHAVVSAPMAGSAWPERGRLVQAAVAQAGMGVYPSYASAPWGLVVRNISTTYTPYFAAGQGGSLTRNLHVNFLVTELANNDQIARVQCLWRNEPGLNSADRIVVRIAKWGLSVDVIDTDGTDVPGNMADSDYFWAFATEQQAGGNVWVTVTPEGNVTARLGDATGPAGSVTLTPGITTTPLKLVQAFSRGDGADIGGLQVLLSVGVVDLHSWDRTAVIETARDGQLSAVPAIVNRQGLDLLKEQAKAELAAMWIDATGRLRYRSRDRFLSSTPVVTITADSVEDLGWRSSWGSVRESVGVKYRVPSSSRARYPRIEAWQGSAISMVGSETWEEVVHPPADTDWINVDGFQFLTDTPAALLRFNRARGSWLGGVIEYEDTNGDQVTYPATGTYLSGGLTRVDDQSYRLTATSANLPDTHTLRLKTPGWNKLAASRRNENLPIVRAFDVITWADAEAVGLPLGVDGTGVLEHDAGFWVQRPATAQAIADHLAESTATARPVYDAIDMATPDPRLELADKATINLPGLTQQGLIVGIDLTIDGGGMSQSLAVQITTTTTL